MAVPATIAMIDGKIKVGLSTDDLTLLARSGSVKKAGKRDLGLFAASGLTASFTVSATMFCAAKAGIRFFATGGIGGVHRGVGESFDISSDLIEMARSRVVVVSAGAKAILDLQKTLEFLETQCVPVIGYKSREFPAFYSTHSGLFLDIQVNNSCEAARAIRSTWSLGIETGILIANPLPLQLSIPSDQMEKMISEALNKAKHANISGKNLTPYLLKYLNEVGDGIFLRTNIEILRNNVKVCSDIACSYFNIGEKNKFKHKVL